jgi:hypothetical protein
VHNRVVTAPWLRWLVYSRHKRDVPSLVYTLPCQEAGGAHLGEAEGACHGGANRADAKAGAEPDHLRHDYHAETRLCGSGMLAHI